METGELEQIIPTNGCKCLNAEEDLLHCVVNGEGGGGDTVSTVFKLRKVGVE